MLHGELEGDITEEADLPDLLGRGQLWECNYDKANQIWAEYQSAFLMAKLGVLTDEQKDETIEHVGVLVNDYCASCKLINNTNDLTTVREKTDATEFMDWALDPKGLAPSLWEPYRPEYILVERK